MLKNCTSAFQHTAHLLVYYPGRLVSIRGRRIVTPTQPICSCFKLFSTIGIDVLYLLIANEVLPRLYHFVGVVMNCRVSVKPR